jgi:predicted SAM-dependent methyltransferase
MRILDIGCNGEKCKKVNPNDEVVGLDIQKFPDVDVVHNLEEVPLPFENESFDMVYANSVIEHIKNVIPLMDVFKISGVLVFVCEKK